MAYLNHILELETVIHLHIEREQFFRGKYKIDR